MSIPRANDDPGPAPSVRGLSFLAGGGDMGMRMRALDWARTSLGPAAQWPQSLKTIIRVMLDSRYAMWMLWGPEFTFFCNDAYLPTVGNKRDWVLGSRADKVWEEIWPDIGPRIARVLDRGQATWDEGLMLFLERSGFTEETYHTFSYSPVYNDEDRIAGMLCVVTEVTERVIGERRLRALRDLAARISSADSIKDSGQRLCDVLSQYPLDIPFAALYEIDDCDRRLRCVAHTEGLDFNLLGSGLVGDNSRSLLRKNFASSDSSLEVERLPDLGISIPAGPWPDPVQRALVLPLRLAGSDGQVGVLVVGISPRRPLDEGYRSFVGLVARKFAAVMADAHAFEAQRLRAEALAEIDRAKTIFYSNVSHEFRTPLTLMLGPIEQALADGRLPADMHERLSMVQRNSLRLLRLVNSLLDFARIEAGRVQASFEPTDLTVLTRDLASTFRSAIERAGLHFVVDSEELNEPVFVDRDMWEKIILNLLSNAFKFTLAGQITVRLRRENGHALLTVSDTGAGIAPEELPRLFERFHRIEGTSARTQEGSGIGLALVQELVELHGGSINVASEPGKGTAFSVLLPLGSAHLPAEGLDTSRLQVSVALGPQAFVQEALRWLPEDTGSTISSLPALSCPANSVRDPRFAKTYGRYVLVADDNADIRAYIRNLLAPIYSVETVADGQQALAAARLRRPDLILADVMMPHLDGFGLLHEIRLDQALSGVPLVLLSARAGEEARIEGFDAGADDYLTKPFSARELVARVGALLELDGTRRESDQALRRRSEQFQTLLNDAPLGVYLVDADLRIREANPLGRAMFGDIDDLIGQHFEQVMRLRCRAEYVDEMAKRFRHTLETGESYYTPECLEERLAGHTSNFHEWQINRIALPDGGFGVVCYFRDISIHVRARNALQDADRQKNEFLAMLAHELRNPLAPIQNATAVLASTSLQDPRVHFSVGAIKRQVTHLTRLVDDLLDVSRITHGRIELKREPLALGEIVAQAVEVVDSLVREKQHEVSISSSVEPLYVLGDNERLVQCIGNILTNSAKYTDPGGTIRIRWHADDASVILEISDNGVGVSPDLLPRIFDLFVQSDRTLDRSQGGLGVGLSLVKRLIEMHNGQVVARSDGIGRGAFFEIRLPRAAAPIVVSHRYAPLAVAPLRILIVDDNVDAADSLAMMLEVDGHATKAVYSSTDVLQCAPGFDPDVVLLDIGLPQMNGHEVAEKLRSMRQLDGVRLIAVTGYGRSEDHKRNKKSGFDDHLVKPVDPSALTEALARLTNGGLRKQRRSGAV